MNDLFLAFLAGMFGTELVQKFVDKNGNIKPPFLLIFCVCYSMVSIFIVCVELLTYIIHRGDFNVVSSGVAGLIMTILLSLGVYAMFKGKQQENKRKKK